MRKLKALSLQSLVSVTETVEVAASLFFRIQLAVVAKVLVLFVPVAELELVHVLAPATALASVTAFLQWLYLCSRSCPYECSCFYLC